MEELLFTSSSLLDLLSQIKELEGMDISLYEYSDGVHLEIGDSHYIISDDLAEEVAVPQEALENIDSINDKHLDDLVYSGMTVEQSEYIECGILGQLMKTLAVGGLVRLTAKLLRK